MPIVRYPDVLLMKMEAVLRGGAGSVSSVTSSKDFQTYMARCFRNDTRDVNAGVALFKECYGDPDTWTLEDVLDERGRELSWEMVRRRDLIRYGKFGDIEYVTKKDEVRKWFPIPYSVLEKSLVDENGNKVWTQTPGYENL